MTTLELAALLKSNMFADRETINEAYEYANEIAKATDNPAAVITAVQVVVNTIAKTIEEIEETEAVHLEKKYE